jgi:hypothetical protein
MIRVSIAAAYALCSTMPKDARRQDRPVPHPRLVKGRISAIAYGSRRGELIEF